MEARKITRLDISKPKYIVREQVGNVDTLRALSSQDSGTPEFLTVFLNETPNGKHTNRVLSDFSFSPKKAYYSEDAFDIIVELYP